ncbi:hypothetical protein Q5752_006142 [Cryptotrichosporon argae]
MPSELLHFPPAYSLVGLYRLATDGAIRGPVLDKVRHAALRGLAVGLAYAVASWRPLGWFVRTWLVGRQGVGKTVDVGFAGLSLSVDLVLYTHVLVLLPQLTNILRFFLRKNLRLARSRAYALTVASRGKPAAFWNQGYIEEWANPPPSASADVVKAGRRAHQEVWLKWLLWWPIQMALRHYLLIPLSPNLPLVAPLVTSTLRALQTAEYLHQPYFAVKNMGPDDVWRWVEERKWAYRAFGFSASLLEGVPIVGPFLSISNRIGAAMWAHDLEKRQHLFSAGVLRPLAPPQVGILGMGAMSDNGLDIQAAEDALEQQWSRKRRGHVAGADERSEDADAAATGETTRATHDSDEGSEGFVEVRGPGKSL